MGTIDANVIIRYKTNDHPKMALAARKYLKQVGSGLETYLCEAVVSEVVYVLTSKSLYNLSREEVKNYLTHLINLKGIVVSNKSVLLRSLLLFSATKLDFVDALLAAYVESRKFDHVVTFDAGIAKATGVSVQTLA